MTPEDPPHRLADGEIHLWALPADAARVERLCADALVVLSPDERARLGTLTRPSVARRYLLARGLLRRGLAWHLGASPAELEFRYSATGKPLLVRPNAGDLAFSLSHASSAVVLAVARARAVGVDLEPDGRAAIALRIARRFYSEAERQYLNALGESAAPYALMLWTLKESLTKAMGRTVWDSLAGLSLAVEGDRIRWLAPPPDDAASWRLTLGRFRDGHTLALALEPLDGGSGKPLRYEHHVLGSDEAVDALFRPTCALP